MQDQTQSMVLPDTVGISSQDVTVTGCLNPFNFERSTTVCEEGLSLFEMALLLSDGKGIPGDSAIFIGGRRIHPEYWRHCYPKAGTLVVIRVSVHDAGLARTAAFVGVAIAAAAVSGGAAAPLLGSAFAGGTFGASAGALAVTAVGMLSINALIPLSQSKYETQTTSPTLSITGSKNTEKPFSPVPQVLGYYRYTPPLAASSFTSLDGNDQKLTMLVTPGYGPLRITDFYIKETPIESFTDVTLQVKEGYSDDDPIELYPGDVQQDPLNIRIYNGTYGQTGGAPHPDVNPCTLPGITVLVPNPNCYMRVTPAACYKFRIDFTFPNGIIRIKDQGDRLSMTVTMETWWRVVGDTGNYTAGPTLAVTGKTNSVIRRSLFVEPPESLTGELSYEVVVRRLKSDDREGPDPDGDNTRYSQSNWTALSAYSNTDPISDGTPICMAEVAMEIVASSQLNGVIDELSMMCRTVCLDYTGVPGVWTKRITNNPASLFRYVLQGNANKNPLADCRIDIDKLEQWHTFCRLRGYTFNMVRDFTSTVGVTLNDVAAAGRARRDVIDGLWTVVIDDQDNYSIPAGLYTPRNSWNFEMTRQFIDPPHAFRVRFMDEDNFFKQDQLNVFDLAYNELSATRYETTEYPGITNRDQIICMAKHKLAVARLRQKRYIFTTDCEYLTCVVGDSILFQNDIIKIGTGAARVTAIDTGTDIVTVDTMIERPTTEGIEHRTKHNVITSHQVNTANGVAIGELENQWHFYAGLPANIAVGDLVTIGEFTSKTLHLVVDNIFPHSDLTASLHCYDVAPDTDVSCP